MSGCSGIGVGARVGTWDSFWGAGKHVLELHSGDGSQLCGCTENTACILSILWYVNYILIFINRVKT